jgi:hypothetical protein
MIQRFANNNHNNDTLCECVSNAVLGVDKNRRMERRRQSYEAANDNLIAFDEAQRLES